MFDFKQSYLKKIPFLLLPILSCGLRSLAHAQTLSPVVSNSSEDSKAEKPVKVLQNRYFLKAMRPEVSVFGGLVLNESYSRTQQYGARIGIFPVEAWGVEATYGKFIASDSGDLTALKQIHYFDNKGKPLTIEPSYVRLNNVLAITCNFVPIYGKINLLDLNIIYSDLYFNSGLATMATSQGNKTAFILGGGQRFYFAKNYNIRADFTDHVFQETRENLGQEKQGWHHGWTVSLGASIFLTDAN